MIDLPLATSAEDALSQPARARLFARLGELKRPVATAEAFQTTLVALGFQPPVQGCTEGRSQSVAFPYRDAVRGHQPVVSTLYRGVLDVLEPDAELAGFAYPTTRLVSDRAQRERHRRRELSAEGRARR